MIVANMATFPARKEMMLEVVKRIAPQVDRLNICLNEYTQIPIELHSFANVSAVIPDEDLADRGKFLFDVAPDDVVLSIDDDINYPENYVEYSLNVIPKGGLEHNFFGYHGYTNAPRREYNFRIFRFRGASDRLLGATILGTGTAFYLGRNFPKLADMEGAQKYVDLRLSMLAQARGLRLWMLPRKWKFVDAMPEAFERGREIHNTVPHIYYHPDYQQVQTGFDHSRTEYHRFWNQAKNNET